MAAKSLARQACIALLLLLFFQVSKPISAHGGGTNQYGCHNQTSTGTYHCHSGPYNGLSFTNEQAFLDYISPNIGPSASIVGGNRTIDDSDGESGETITLIGSASDSDGSVLSTIWTVNGLVVNTGSTATFFIEDGTHTVLFQATDNDGASSIASIVVTVQPPLVASIPEYNRDDYLPDWSDADGDCINTRHEVLILESTIPVTMSSNGCSVLNGLWNDPFTGLAFTNPSDVDVDHLVALAEAHRSGGYMWTNDQKQSFANDLLRADALRAIDDGTNSSKSDRDPAEWLPPNSEYHCEYVRDWVEIKNSYGLTFDDAERSAIESVLGSDISMGAKPIVMGIRETPGDSTAEFRLGMTKNGECAYSQTALASDLIQIDVSVTPEQAHLELTANFYLVAAIGESLFTINGSGDLALFGGTIGDLVPIIQAHNFQESFNFSVPSNIITEPSTISIYIGYLSASGEFVYTPTPFSLLFQ